MIELRVKKMDFKVMLAYLFQYISPRLLMFGSLNCEKFNVILGDKVGNCIFSLLFHTHMKWYCQLFSPPIAIKIFTNLSRTFR